jgi:hypothetical protein
MENILERFLRYVAVDTQSDDRNECQPSTAKQFDLQKLLQAELQAMGISAEVDEYGYLMASIPSNVDKTVPAIGFIAHVDTSPDCSGKDVKPQIVENYNGEDIVLIDVILILCIKLVLRPKGETESVTECNCLDECSRHCFEYNILIQRVILHGIDSIEQGITVDKGVIVHRDIDSHLVASVDIARLIGEGLLRHKERGAVIVINGSEEYLLRTVFVQKVYHRCPR